jgi:hypothetical protein
MTAARKKTRTKEVSKTGFGTIRPKGTMILRRHVGEAKGDSGAYEMSLGLPSCQPIITSQNTGKQFALSWEEITMLAVVAGIDEEDA